jgi:cytidyltransferase-like protein
MTVLLTFGTFDCPHAGHAAFLRRCERFADRVVVAIRSDDMVVRQRGHKPVFTFAERAAIVAALGYEVTESVEPGCGLVDAIRPDVLAIGSDWSQHDWLARLQVDQATLDVRGITLVFVPYTPGISASELKRRLGGAQWPKS